MRDNIETENVSPLNVYHLAFKFQHNFQRKERVSRNAGKSSASFALDFSRHDSSKRRKY